MTRANGNSERYIAETQNGAVQGYNTGKCLFFGGIPYAAPVAEAARFKPPRKPDNWTDLRPAVHAGPVVSQNPTRFDPFLGPDPQPQSEDALRLNVWTPALDDEKRPVYVWIHGGAYVSGSGSFPLYNGANFAKNGDIVCVSINYRLGDRGYLDLGHIDSAYKGSGNNALRDQVMALRWVRDNIASFGGDPEQVTLGGQSAGGGSITGLMMMAKARGLFHRAIIQSIALMSFRGKALAEQATATFMEKLGANTIADIEAAPIGELLTAQRATMRSRPPWRKVAFQPVIDGEELTQDILPAARAGEMMDIPVMLGVTRDEWKPFQFFMNPDDVPRDRAALTGFFDRLTGDGEELVSAYQGFLGDVEPVEIFAAAMSDWRWRRPTMALADALHARQPVYYYEFGWKSPAQDGRLGAGHCVDLPFCFDNLHTPSTPYLIGTSAPQALADAMHASWCAFIRSGDPAVAETGTWDAYDGARRATMILDETTASAHDPWSERRQFWEAFDGAGGDTDDA